MKYMSIATINFIALLSFLQINCKSEEQIIPPVEKPSIHPTITWTGDTIRNPYLNAQFILESIWGTDTNNIYATGWNGFGGRASLYQYDGQQWKAIKITTGEGGFIGSYVHLRKLDGSGKNDVWAIGLRGGYYGSSTDSSVAIHFDGKEWKEVLMPRCKDFLNSIKVFSPNNVYLGGSYGEIYYYDGTSFQKTYFDSTMDVLSIDGDGVNILAAGGELNGNYGVFSKLGSEPWKMIQYSRESDYARENTFGSTSIYHLGGGKYFTSDVGIYYYDGTHWSRVYSDGYYAFYWLRGTSANNVFALSNSFKLVHWNGMDWKPVNLPEGLDQKRIIAGLWTYKNNIYLSYQNTYSSAIIYKGSYQ